MHALSGKWYDMRVGERQLSVRGSAWVLYWKWSEVSVRNYGARQPNGHAGASGLSADTGSLAVVHHGSHLYGRLHLHQGPCLSKDPSEIVVSGERSLWRGELGGVLSEWEALHQRVRRQPDQDLERRVWS